MNQVSISSEHDNTKVKFLTAGQFAVVVDDSIQRKPRILFASDHGVHDLRTGKTLGEVDLYTPVRRLSRASVLEITVG